MASRTRIDDHLGRLLESSPRLAEVVGRVTRANGTTVCATGLVAAVGQRCTIVSPDGCESLFADVVGIAGDEITLFPYGPIDGITHRSLVRVHEHRRSLAFSTAMTGRVLDALGHPLDRGERLAGTTDRPLDAAAPDPLVRQPITRRFTTGVGVVDGLLTVGVGQRIGVFSAAGAGKSTLLAMLARHASTDVIVLALIGERGREVREFLEESLGTRARARSVVVVATSDRPAMERVTAAQTATAIAEGFRALGKRVLLLVDSVTRYARALREVGLSSGELPVRRGFTPSVFAELPRLFERAGNDDRGSITAFYTVLVEDEERHDPIAEETRSLLDGHLVLTRELADAGRFPAIDPLRSVSRLFRSLARDDQRRAAASLRRLLAKYRDVEFLVQIGEYERGSDPVADKAIEARDAMQAWLDQSADVRREPDETLATLGEIVGIDIEAGDGDADRD